MRDRVAVYPGSFDPVTNGHLDVLQRGLDLFDRVIVAVLRNPSKDPLFRPDERQEMIERAVEGMGDVAVDVFDGLLVEYARTHGANAILRGVRAVSDFEYEFQMALMNRKLDPDIQTVFMMPNEAYSYVSSRLVKEVAALGGAFSQFVPAHVEKRVRERLGERERG